MSGGGQYLLKNTTFEVWDKIYKDCTPLFDSINSYHKTYPIEYGGIQIWTAEMWSMLWNLWKFSIETEISPLLDFSWATDPIKVYESKPILHLAGVTVHTRDTMFYKGEFIDMNPIEIIKECPSYFDYVDKNNSTYIYINLIKDYVNSTKYV